MEKTAAVKLDMSGAEAMKLVNKRYSVGSKIGTSGIVERIEQVNDHIMIYFRAAANAVATVFGSIHDAFMFNCRCTLMPQGN
jgi:hypothetical protein